MRRYNRARQADHVKLRTQLFLLVSGTVIPLLALAAVLAYILLQHESETFRDGARDRNRAFMSAVDAELRGHIKTLEALATSDDLERNDLQSFYAEATRVLAAQPGWSQVILSDGEGRQLGQHALAVRVAPGACDPSCAEPVVRGSLKVSGRKRACSR